MKIAEYSSTMELDQLRYFAAVAETQHIGQAARSLHISPIAISHSIKKLEEELGQELLEKRGKYVRLTEEGHRLAVRAKDLLERADRLKQDFRSQKLPLEGRFRIGATHGLAALILAPRLGELQREYPDLRFEVSSLRSSQVVEQLAAGVLDIGFCFSPYPHPAVSAPKAHSGIENCEDHPSLKAAGIKARPDFIFDSYEVAAAFVRRTDYWCLIPEIFVDSLNLKKVEVPAFAAEAAIVTLGVKGRMLPPPLIDKLRIEAVKPSR